VKREYKIPAVLLILTVLYGSLFYAARQNKNITGQKEGNGKIVVDSRMTLSEAVEGIDIPPEIKKTLTLVEVRYYSFDGELHSGQLLINRELAKEAAEIFSEIEKNRFPLKSVIPVSKFNWDDETSMRANNSSAFNYRLVKGTRKLSAHSNGRAIDINPLQNPQIKRGKTLPLGAVYNKNAAGTITPGSFIVKAFKKRGWQWGGEWHSSKDYQHFEKPR
jgi:hypothetical protein